jgi:hypothetical protein
MFRITNTVFNNISSYVNNNQKIQFVQDALILGRQDRYIFIDENVRQLSLSTFAYIVGFSNQTYNTPINLYFDQPGRSLLFGTDTLDFAQSVVDILGLSNDIPDITNFTLVSFRNFATIVSGSPQIPLLFGSNSTTYNYVSFTNQDVTSNSIMLFTNIYSYYNYVTIVATFDDNNRLTNINFIL